MIMTDDGIDSKMNNMYVAVLTTLRHPRQCVKMSDPGPAGIR